MKKVFVVLILAVNSSAMFIDDSDYFISVKDVDDRRYFYQCHRPTSTCHPLTPEGLQSEDFARLATILDNKHDKAIAGQNFGDKLKKGAIALLVLTTTLAVYRLYRHGAIHLVSKCHECTHGMWHKLRDHLPRVDLGIAKKFFFKDNSWLLPTVVGETLAVVIGGQVVANNVNQQIVYQFLQIELANLQEIDADDEKMVVRSVSAIEFMLYEIVRLQRATNERQIVDH